MDIRNWTLEDKIKLIIGKDRWSFYTKNRFLPLICLSDATIGLRHHNLETDIVDPSIAYPSEQMLANTWNLDLAFQLGKAVANDAIEFNVDVVLGPGLNIKRLPTNGRNFEYFSEDPFLAGLMGKSYIEAMQKEHIGACIKHYCCNNSEISRKWSNMIVDEQTLHEIYLKPFEIACKASPWFTMCAYNLVNGYRMSEHKQLFDILRNDFNFNGLIISDWEATQNLNLTMLSGLDITMPYEERLISPMLELARQGKINEKELDKRVEHILKNIDFINSEKSLRKITLSKKERCKIALEIEEEGIVLLKNNSVLPLKKRDKLIVTGAPTFNYYYGGGSSEVTPSKPFVWLGTAMEQIGGNISLGESVWETVGEQANLGNIVDTCNRAKDYDAVILGVGNDHLCECEGRNRQHIKLSKEQVDAIKYLSRFAKKLIVVVYAGSSIDMSDWIDDVDAIVWAGYGGQYVSEAVSKVLYGEINPSGKLSETFARLEEVPSEQSFIDYDRMVYEEKLNVGYRYFVCHNDKQIFPFGFGLSYSSFEYENMNVEENDEYFEISLDVKNTSNVDGKEIVQIYVRSLIESYNHPLRELKGFSKIFVKANSKESVSIKVYKDDLKHYSITTHSWELAKGKYVLEVGKSSINIVLEKEVEL